jgi:hypothetical protein
MKEDNVMRQLSAFFALIVLSLACHPPVSAFQYHGEKALWVETREHGVMKTTLAVTENIAWMVAESKDTKVHFSGKGKKDLITKNMLRAVLEGEERSITVKDPDRDQTVTLYLKTLDVPGEKGGNDRLVLRTYKAGKKTFSITLPDIEVESTGDDDSEELVTRSFGWKALLPFLARSGGALYIKESKDDTEVWFYVE